MLNHLRKCYLQPKQVHEDVEVELYNRKLKAHLVDQPMIVVPIVQDAIPTPPSVDASLSTQSHGSIHLPVPFINQQPTSPGTSSSGVLTRCSSRANSPYPDSIFGRQSGSRSSSAVLYQATHSTITEWSTDRQHTFNSRIGRITASAGLPLGWIENPEFLLFIQEFVHPSAVVPSRKVLTHRILPTINREFRKKAQATIKKGSMATIQADGWSAINDHHLNAFMMTVERKVCNMLLIIHPDGTHNV